MSRLKELIDELCPDGVEFKKLGEIATESGERNKNRDVTEVRTVTSSSKLVRTSDYFDREITSEDTSSYKVVREGMFVYNPARINIGSIAFSAEKKPVILSPMYVAFTVPQKILLNEFLLYFLKSRKGTLQIVGKVESGARFRFPFASLSRIKVPVPPAEVQREIVRILDKFTELGALLETELVARKKQYEYYREKLLTFPADVPRFLLGEIANTNIGLATSVTKHKSEKGVLLIHNSDIRENRIILKSYEHITNEFAEKNKKKLLQMDDIITVHTGDAGTSAVVTKEFIGAIGFTTITSRIKDKEKSFPKYISHYLNSQHCKRDIYRMTISDRSNLNQDSFEKLMIPLPPLPEQKRIADILDCFDALCNDLSSGIPAEIAARKKQYEYYRDRLLTFREKNF